MSRRRDMQTDTERVLNNLHVLASLTQNDKLLTNDDCFDIHTPTTWRAVYRFYYGEKRNTNVQRVRSCIRSAMEFVTKTLEEVTTLLPKMRPDSSCVEESTSLVSFSPNLEGESIFRLKVETTVMHHFRMMEALKSAKEGLSNLLQTYRDDPAHSSQIRLLIFEISDFLIIMDPNSSSLKTRFSSIFEKEERGHRTQTPSFPSPVRQPSI